LTNQQNSWSAWSECQDWTEQNHHGILNFALADLDEADLAYFSGYWMCSSALGVFCPYLTPLAFRSGTSLFPRHSLYNSAMRWALHFWDIGYQRQAPCIALACQFDERQIDPCILSSLPVPAEDRASARSRILPGAARNSSLFSRCYYIVPKGRQLFFVKFPGFLFVTSGPLRSRPEAGRRSLVR